ncbi:TraQ conjugal transfer family protein [Chryseobacterium sp. CH1]|uniref:TraQ conjugal transfer family protein n=1 Tax=Chryseobacterium sp. CH1 TaxID=713551 RepID=UPI00100A2482|nr:TraQ conjugal transfer family protein [Chryseobacterium sp. CH1]RXM65870.1 hypothetical protein BOQ60_08990 [Chryseobacterium sp. CH1]
MMITVLLLTACEKGLDIQTDFPFEIKTRPVPNGVMTNQTIEIRCKIKKTGNYNGVKYHIRYFQYDGEGLLRMNQSSEDIWKKCADCVSRPEEKDIKAPALLLNEPYLLPSETFNLYYTSLSKEQQSFTIWVKDHFGNERSMVFEFTSKNKE